MDDLEESLEMSYAQALARKERSDSRARAVAEACRRTIFLGRGARARAG
jgi:hypothetical protein